MKKTLSIFSTLVLFCFCALLPGTAAFAVPPWLHVDGNKIKDPNGNVIVLRGVSIMDMGTTELWWGGAINLIDRITNPDDTNGNSAGWSTKIIRVPICPNDSPLCNNSPLTFNPRDPNEPNNPLTLALLRTVVDYCADKDVYVIIDYHHMANTYNEVTEANTFWEYIAPEFAGDSHVLFELFNEPINSGVTETAQWLSVKNDMETWIATVRAYAPNNLILVGTPNYCQILGWVVDNPIAESNIVYVSHLYPSHWLGLYGASQSWYTNHIITCAAEYPVICTEWGFVSEDPNFNSFFDGTITNYGQPFKLFLEQYGISSVAWVASYNWGSPMFWHDWTLRCGETEMGCFTKDWLYEANGGQTTDLTITRCDVKAGKTQGDDANDVNNIKDSFAASGTFASSPLITADMERIAVNIVSLADGNVIYEESMDFDSATDLVDNKYKYNGQAGGMTSLKLDFNKRTIAIQAKNIDLTGLDAPLRLDLGIGNNILTGEASETIVNKTRSIPTRLMRMYQDKLVVTKVKAKQGGSPFTDSLSIKGAIAIADINDYEPNLVNYDVNVSWGEQTFTVPAGNFTAKTGHKYKCSKIASDANAGLVTASFDLNKCTFTIAIKEAGSLDVGTDDEIPFRLRFADFNEVADVNLVLGH